MGLDQGPNILGYRLQLEGESMFTTSFGKARHSVMETHQSLGQLDRGVQQTSRSWAEGALKVGAAAAGFMAVGSVVAKSWDAALENATALKRVGTLLEPGQKAAALFGGSFDKIARKVGIDDAVLLNAGYTALQRNIKQGDLATFMEETAKTSVATAQDLEGTLTATTNAFATYGYTVADAHKVQNLLFEGVRHGAPDIGMLGDLIGRQGYQAKSLGLGLEDVVAAIGTMSAGGVRGAKAMMGLSTILTAMQEPSDDAKATAERLGIAWDTASIKAMGFGKWLQQVQDKLKASEGRGNDPSKSLKALGLGAMTGNTFQALMENAGAYNSILGEIRRGEDIIGLKWAEAEKSPVLYAKRLGVIKEQLWEAGGTGLLKGLAGIGGSEDLDKVMEELGPKLEKFGESVGTVLKQVAEFAIEYLPQMMATVGAALDENKRIKDTTGIDPMALGLTAKTADTMTGGVVSSAIGSIVGTAVTGLGLRWFMGRGAAGAAKAGSEILSDVMGQGFSRFGTIAAEGQHLVSPAGIPLGETIAQQGLFSRLGTGLKGLLSMNPMSAPMLAIDLARADKIYADITRPAEPSYSEGASWKLPGQVLPPSLDSQVASLMATYGVSMEEALLGQSIPKTRDAIDKAFAAFADAFGTGLGDSLANRIDALLGKIEARAEQKKNDAQLFEINLDQTVRHVFGDPGATKTTASNATIRHGKAGAGRAETHINYRFFEVTPGLGVNIVHPLAENVMLAHIKDQD